MVFLCLHLFAAVAISFILFCLSPAFILVFSHLLSRLSVLCASASTACWILIRYLTDAFAALSLAVVVQLCFFLVVAPLLQQPYLANKCCMLAYEQHWKAVKVDYVSLPKCDVCTRFYLLKRVK
jgi:hypothetical protein